jgi:hypothetical protein
LKDTLEYVVLLLDSRPSEADEKIKKPPTMRMPIDMRNGMSTFIVFIKLKFNFQKIHLHKTFSEAACPSGDGLT